MTVVALEPTEVEVPPTLALQLDRECGSSPHEIKAATESGFDELMAFAGTHRVQFTGPPRSIYTAYGPAGVQFTLAIPVAGAVPAEASAQVRVADLPGGKTLRFTHTGPYERLSDTYTAITGWMKEHGRMESEADWMKYMPMWEEYVGNPDTTPPEQLVTHIHLPLP